MNARLPVVVVPILHRFDPLDACLAALESSLARRTRVWLLDDVSSELDPTRNQQLFAFLKTVPCQAFITTTRPTHVLLAEERKDFQVLGGAVLP